MSTLPSWGVVRRIVLWLQNREGRGWEEEVSVVFEDVTLSSRIANQRLVSLGAMRWSSMHI